jgi:antirestriction protein
MNEQGNTNDQPTSYERHRIPRPRLWLTDADDDTDGIWVDAACSVAEVLDRSDGRSRILDSDDFGAFQVRADDDLATVCAVARGIARHGLAYAAWAELHDGDPAMLAGFNDHYFGHFASYEAFGRNLYGATGRELTNDIPADLQPYVRVDFAALARDELDRSRLLVLDAPDGGIYLFRGPDAAEPHSAAGDP